MPMPVSAAAEYCNPKGYSKFGPIALPRASDRNRARIGEQKSSRPEHID
jgi:hypothetical protein